MEKEGMREIGPWGVCACVCVFVCVRVYTHKKTKM